MGSWALVDYNLPGVGGIKALRVLAQAAPDVPAITVSGAISEDTAVATITAGAVDYVLKDNLTRLAPAAQRAVEGAELRCREREAAAMAAESDALYRRIVETAREGIWAMDAEYRTTFVNSQMAQMLGYEVEEMLGRPVTDFMFEEDLAIDGAAMRRISHEVSGSFQAHLRSKDGVEIWASVSSSADLGPGGEFLGSFAMFTDITEHKQAEEEFRRMALAVDTAPDSITVHDLDGRFLYANQRTLELHGYSRDEFLALSLRQLDAPAAEELIAARMQELRERGEASFEAAHFRKDGTTLPVEVRAKLTTWGGKSAILSVATDITERRQAEESLHQSHESCGQFWTRFRHGSSGRTAIWSTWAATRGSLLTRASRSPKTSSARTTMPWAGASRPSSIGPLTGMSSRAANRGCSTRSRRRLLRVG